MRLHKFKLYVKVTVRRLSNPVFFMLLALSLCLWYITKLSYVYTTDIQIPVRIDSTLYSVRCNVEGIGYQILKHKIAPAQRRGYLVGQCGRHAVGASGRRLRHRALHASEHHLLPHIRPENPFGRVARRDRISSARA